MHSSVDGQLGCFPFPVNMGGQVSVWKDIGAFGNMPRSGITELCGRSSSSLLKTGDTNFHEVCIILYSH